mgnify:CR=1 FL=1
MDGCIISKTADNAILYTRYFHPSFFRVCEALFARYGGHPALFPSGMCAIDSLFSVLAIQNGWKRMNVVLQDEMYCDTSRTARYMNEFYVPLNVHKMDVTKNINWAELDLDLPTILMVESCSNPNGHLFNFDQLAELKRRVPNLTVCVDNTWLSSAMLNPFDWPEVDYVVCSLTKYYGAGRSGISGAVMARKKENANALREYGKVKGLHVSPMYCRSLEQTIATMDARLKKTGDMTVELAKFLKGKQFTVHHPTFDGQRTYLRPGMHPSVLTVEIPLSKRVALDWMRSSKRFECSTSYGGPDSRFDQWPSRRNGLTVCRFSVGYDDNIKAILKEWSDLLVKMAPRVQVYV